MFEIKLYIFHWFAWKNMIGTSEVLLNNFLISPTLWSYDRMAK